MSQNIFFKINARYVNLDEIENNNQETKNIKVNRTTDKKNY